MRTSRRYLANMISQLGLSDRRKLGVEVGVGTGATSAYLLSLFPKLILYSVDPWRPPAEGHPWIATGDRRARFTAEEQERRYQQAQVVLSTYEGRAVILRDYSVQAADKMRNFRFDFVFIDGAHDYWSVSEDLMAWWPLVRPGGLFCGHDYSEPPLLGIASYRWALHRYERKLAGVKWAVDEFAARMDVKVTVAPCSVWSTWKE